MDEDLVELAVQPDERKTIGGCVPCLFLCIYNTCIFLCVCSSLFVMVMDNKIKV